MNEFTTLLFGFSEISINGNKSDFKGLNSTNYYGANYDDNTYVQKKYVDDKTVIDSTPTDGSTNAVSSNGVFDALNNRQKRSAFKVSTGSVTGTISQTIIDSIELPANFLENNREYLLNADLIKNNTAINEYFAFVNTSNSLSGATQLGRVLSTSAGRYFPFERLFYVTGNELNIRVGTSINTLSNRVTANNNADLTTVSLTLASPIFFIFACVNADTSTVSTCGKINLSEQ